MDNKLFILFTLTIGVYLILRGIKESRDHIINISIKIRYFGAGIMLLVAAIIIVIKELNK
ncbi:hypothetical protein [Leadbetterella sp. DM7]|uniref:hypothetical protein n=1 Tax=Leadbetterella sp. DM7 TaxID=3235085 RepID=UPI00349E6EE0